VSLGIRAWPRPAIAVTALALLAVGTLAVLLVMDPFDRNPSGHALVAARGSPSPSATASATDSPSPGALAGVPSTCPRGQVVTDASQLQAALSAAQPGTVIDMLPGTYQQKFVASVSGTADAPITLCGDRTAVIDGGGIKKGYGIYLNGASWWRLVGFSVDNSQKGVVTDHVQHTTIVGLYVHDVGDEGIHLRSFSTDDTVEGNLIRRTGLLNAKFGEGIYIGSAHHNWCTYTSCLPDASDRNVIKGNDIAQTTAENIDVKEGTTAGTIIANHLSGDGMVASAASAWVNVKGNAWTIEGNVGVNSVKDGFQVHVVYKGWGERNVFLGNQATVDGPGYGFYVQSKSTGTRLACDNTATGAGRGFSNLTCT
jgi:hypothetical protein